MKWVNEKLLFMRPWWGRILGTDLIYDVEAERIVYAETVTDGYLAYQQFRESWVVIALRKKLARNRLLRALKGEHANA